MLKSLFSLIVSLMICSPLWAMEPTLITQIAHIESPDADSESYHILTYFDGRVYQLDAQNQETLKVLLNAKLNQHLVVLELERNYIEDDSYQMETIASASIINEKGPIAKNRPSLTAGSRDKYISPTRNFTPTDLESLDQAQMLFNQLYPRTKWFTQCFNRAHIWNRQMQKDHGVSSEKIFIFYTKKYRREVNDKWWFHVAPQVSVNGARYVLDKEFVSRPLTSKEWENHFNQSRNRSNGKECVKIDRMSIYYDQQNTQNEFCNILVSSMYYWEPNHLEALEKQDKERTDWVAWELRAAAKDVFWSWRSMYRRYQP